MSIVGTLLAALVAGTVILWGVFVQGPRFAVLLLVFGPVLGSTVRIGSYTLDNLMTLLGVTVCGFVFFLTRGVPRTERSFTKIAAVPFSVAVAILFSNVSNGLPFLTEAFRYVSIGVFVVLLCSRALIGFAEKTYRAACCIGALSVFLGDRLPIAVSYADHETDIIRSGGLFGHPNFAAYCCALAALSIFLQSQVTLARLVELGLLVGAMLMTGSLGAFVALVVVIAIASVRTISVRSIALAMMLVVGAVVGGGSLLIRAQVYSTAGSQNSLSWRIGQWERIIAISESSRLTGVGWQMTGEILGNGLGAHSAYVGTYAELGLLGMGIIVAGGVYGLKTEHKGHQGAIVLLFVAMTSFTDPVYYYPSAMVGWLTIYLTVIVRGHDFSPVGRQVDTLLLSSPRVEPESRDVTC